MVLFDQQIDSDLTRNTVRIFAGFGYGLFRFGPFRKLGINLVLLKFIDFEKEFTLRKVLLNVLEYFTHSNHFYFALPVWVVFGMKCFL